MPQSPEDEFAPLIEALSAGQARRHPLEERLRAIEERSGKTAPAIYEKVKREAVEKLRALDAELATMKGDVERARATLTTRESSLGAELERANEMLEEVRFRNTLGEYSPEQFQAAESDALAAVESQRAGLQSVAEIASLLDGFLKARPTATALPPPPPAPPTATPPKAAVGVPPGASPAPAPGPESEPAVPVSLLDPAPTFTPLLTATPPPLSVPTNSSELEALFGSGSAPPPRLADLPAVPAAAEASRPGFSVPERDHDRTRSADSYGYAGAMPKKIASEESTEDLKLPSAPPTAPRPAFPSAASDPSHPAAKSGPFRPTLVVKTRDKDRGEDTYELAAGATLIGRAPENDVILLEESVSRRHARILVENSECFFEDLGSANGSFINAERLKPKAPRKLQDNDLIKMGQLLAYFRVNPED